MNPGIVKGTPLSAINGTHLQQGNELVQIKVIDLCMNPFYRVPVKVTWKWEKDVICLANSTKTLKVTPNATLITGTGEVNASQVVVGDIVKGLDNFVVESVDHFRVLSPIVSFFFEEPCWICARGIFIRAMTP